MLRSSNEHGVHSPFVYNLVTKCFYKKHTNIASFKKFEKSFPPFFGLKQIAILDDLFGYLRVEKVSFLSENNDTVKQFFGLENYEEVSISKAQAVYVQFRKKKLEKWVRIFNSLENDSFLIVEAPYENPGIWRSLKDELKCKVVVDTYYFALVFKRKQQAEEIFEIRI